MELLESRSTGRPDQQIQICQINNHTMPKEKRRNQKSTVDNANQVIIIFFCYFVDCMFFL